MIQQAGQERQEGESRFPVVIAEQHLVSLRARVGVRALLLVGALSALLTVLSSSIVAGGSLATLV